MKHPVPAELDELLRTQLAELSLSVDDERRAAILAFLCALLEVNRTINLTRITDKEEAVRLHVVDSLSALPELSGAPLGPFLDLGTGGGFPGVPLAVASGRTVVLLDSVAKKGAAVSAALESLPGQLASVTVQSGRAEELGARDRDSFAAVVARAVAPMPALVELSAPLLMDGGLLIALKGCPESAELESGAAVGAIVGMRQVSLRDLALPRGGESRTIVVYRKTGRSAVELPRRTGLAQHSPLA